MVCKNPSEYQNYGFYFIKICYLGVVVLTCSATEEVKAGGSLEPRNLRPAWAA
jgi:hypothetical protein